MFKSKRLFQNLIKQNKINKLLTKPKVMVGTLHVIISCMFAGKSTELIRLKTRAEIARKKCITIKYKDDNRYSSAGCVVTHDNIRTDAIIAEDNKLLTKTIENIENINQYQCIFIDEIQFYNDADVVCDKLAELGFQVIVCGLKADYKGNPFGKIPELIARADDITFLKAICQVTGDDASFTIKKESGNDIVDIGGSDKYLAVSRKGRQLFNDLYSKNEVEKKPTETKT
jgi:thymidine kinase